MAAFLSFLLKLFVIASSFTTSAHNNYQQANNGRKIILTQTSYITVTVWQGSALCTGASIDLVKPEALATSITTNLTQQSQSKTIGPIPAGEEVVFNFKPTGLCAGNYFTTDQKRALVTYLAEKKSWQVGLEDYFDNDFNDDYIEITPTVKQNIIADQISSGLAFDPVPTYKLPWPAGTSHKISQIPGLGEHTGIDAYDFDMHDTILASEKGLVLWVEDNFGPGGCSALLAPKTNVVVIQTEDDVNQTYVHLQKGSVTAAGIKVGDLVQRGQVIGRTGNSGFVCSSSGDGTHLHIEWQHNCYDTTISTKLRATNRYKIGQPTLIWSCKNYPPDSPFSFTTNSLTIPPRVGSSFTSDNQLGK